MSGLGRWQRPDGFPTDEYFKAVLAAVRGAGVGAGRQRRDEGWAWVMTLRPSAYAAGSFADHEERDLEVMVSWSTEQPTDPAVPPAQRITWPGWQLLSHVRRGVAGQVHELDVDWLGEPEQVAAAVVAVLRGGPGARP